MAGIYSQNLCDFGEKPRHLGRSGVAKRMVRSGQTDGAFGVNRRSIRGERIVCSDNTNERFQPQTR